MVTLPAVAEKDIGELFGHHLPMRSRMSMVQVILALVLANSIVLVDFAGEEALARELRAATVLEELVVKGRAPKTGYDRALFGSPWADVDRNGCDTRNDILARDLQALVFEGARDRCIIIAGTLIDPYSGATIDFIRGRVTSLEVQIDHVVSLSNAWQTGAFRWSGEKRKRFANDPLNLLAVKGSLNAQKGDGDAATWLPPRKSYRCDYVARQIAVKARYALRVTAPEKEAMERILRKCPRQQIPAR